MDLRHLPAGLSSAERCENRLEQIEKELGVDLSALQVMPERLGEAESKNCENMFGHVALPVGLAGPLTINFSSSEKVPVYIPLATTEGALIASVSRGCKALEEAVKTSSEHVGITRSLALKVKGGKGQVPDVCKEIEELNDKWKEVAQATSSHLKVLNFEIETDEEYLFLTLACDTDEAMGMNMVTIAAQAVGDWLVEKLEGVELITVAGNVDSDKKPSQRTHEKGRGYTVTAEATISADVISEVLKSNPEALLEVAKAKLEHGSKVAGAIGANLHAANTVAAFYLATGQDIAHTVEGSLADTNVILSSSKDGIKISVKLPAVLIGVRGGGTALPAQRQCLDLVLNKKTKLHSCAQLAETLGATVLAGELSLLAAQASQDLAKAHKKLGR